jgi:hypothetical protein
MPEAQIPPPEVSRHGYWGPLPGESPELYRALGAPAMERIILSRVPDYYRGEFNMEAGRDPDVAVRSEAPPPPAELTREERLERFVRFTQENESAHAATFVIMGAIGTSLVFVGSWLGTASAILIGTANVIFNIPPIMVQRYNRLRAYRLLDKMGNRRSEPE